jgi:hypothetical protein
MRSTFSCAAAGASDSAETASNAARDSGFFMA